MVFKKTAISGIFIVFSVASLVTISYITFLLFASYNIVYGIEVSILNMAKMDDYHLRINVSIGNPSRYSVALQYIKVEMYADGCHLEAFQTYYSNPKKLNPFHNITVTITLNADAGDVLPSEIRYWYTIVYLNLRDVPVVSRAYLTRIISSFSS